MGHGEGGGVYLSETHITAAGISRRRHDFENFPAWFMPPSLTFVRKASPYGRNSAKPAQKLGEALTVP